VCAKITSARRPRWCAANAGKKATRTWAVIAVAERCWRPFRTAQVYMRLYRNRAKCAASSHLSLRDALSLCTVHGVDNLRYERQAARELAWRDKVRGVDVRRDVRAKHGSLVECLPTLTGVDAIVTRPALC